ncbi:hypothetical protein [Kosakonia cowanii]|uniref:hypothetical protein n=1 Tax=Kosakonia cowanii TaxID=208223 RepID=UPI0025A9C9D5|nr:hypothetical protein [Kosakonia cowanii]MDM9617504.1 hypothetical protein [Kosakonia cowanii]MDP4562611.1 hypothetical protein [Kosakonia cowanii]
MQTLLLRKIPPGNTYVLNYANETRITILPQTMTPESMARAMQGGPDAFRQYMADSGANQVTRSRIEQMCSNSNKFRYNEFAYEIEGEELSLFKELEKLGRALAEFLP